MSLVVFAGFLPSFFFRFHFRDTPLPLYLVVHGIVMTLWQLLFLAQTALIASGRTDFHRRVGMAGAVLAITVVAVGIYAVLNQPHYYASLGIKLPFPVDILVIGNLFGFGLFAGFVGTAIAHRRAPQTHKRLMFWACVVTMGPALTPSRALGAAIGPYFPTTFPPEIALVWVAWIALLCHDWLSARRFHPATIAGGMLVLFIVPAIVDWTMVIPAVGAWVQTLA